VAIIEAVKTEASMSAPAGGTVELISRHRVVDGGELVLVLS